MVSLQAGFMLVVGGFAVNFLLVQAGYLNAVLCIRESCIGLCGLSSWGNVPFGAEESREHCMQGLQSIQHGQRGAGQEVVCIAVDVLLSRPAL